MNLLNFYYLYLIKMQEANRRIQEWIRNGDINRSLTLSSLGLTELPDLPQYLRILICRNNRLEIFPNLPNTLRILDCSNNQLRSLSENLSQLNYLQKLHCGLNQLTSLPTLPDNLQILGCSNNQLETLPTLPTNLKELWCASNKLETLPTLPNMLQILSCYNNELRSLPEFPTTLHTLNIEGNPNLVLTSQQSEFIRNLDNEYENEEEEDEEEEDEDEDEDEEDEEEEEDEEHMEEEPMEEESSEQLETRTNLGNERMNQITAQNTQLIESALADIADDENLNALNLQELDEKEQSVYKSRCSNTNDLIGDTLDTRYGDVVIIDISNPDKYMSYCFTYPESDSMWNYAKTYNVHPYLGYKINQRGVLLSKLYNTLVLRKIDGIKYTLDPIPRSVFIREEKITPNIIKNFQPTLDDINQYYLNGKEDEFSKNWLFNFLHNLFFVNIKLENINLNIYKITGKYGSIEVDKTTNRINNIIKISDSISYKINSDIVNII